MNPSIFCVPFVVNITTDNFPDETGWSLYNECSNVGYYLGEGYSDKEASTFYSNEYCVPPARYTLRFHDYYGDGLDPDVSNGYNITYDGIIVKSGEGDFGHFEDTVFGTCPGDLTVQPIVSPSSMPSISVGPSVSPQPSPIPSVSDQPSTTAMPSNSPTTCVPLVINGTNAAFPNLISWTLDNKCTNVQQLFVAPLEVYQEEDTFYSNEYCVPPARYEFGFYDESNIFAVDVTYDGIIVNRRRVFGECPGDFE